MFRFTEPPRWTRLSVIPLSLVFLLGAAMAFEAVSLAAQAPVRHEY
jgi:hypothetical protein